MAQLTFARSLEEWRTLSTWSLKKFDLKNSRNYIRLLEEDEKIYINSEALRDLRKS